MYVHVHLYVSIGMAFIQNNSYHVEETAHEQVDPSVLPTTEHENSHQSEEEPQNANGFRESVQLEDESDSLINTQIVPSKLW